MAVNVQGIGNALGAMGAGISGNLPAYMAAQNQEEKLRMEQAELRKKATFEDNRQMLTMASAGDFERPLQILGERVGAVRQSGGDPSHSLYMIDLIQRGELDQAIGQLKEMDAIGVNGGYVAAMPGPDKYMGNMDGNMIAFTGNQQENLGGNFQPSGGGTSVTVNSPGSKATDAMSKALGEVQADEYGAILTTANNAASSLQQLNAMQSLGDSTDTGVFQANKFAISQYVDGFFGDGYSESIGLIDDVTGLQVFNSLKEQSKLPQV